MSDICFLCGESLNVGKTNLEHYVPQVLLRNFDKLGIPTQDLWALRINEARALNNKEKTLAPFHKHREWATVRVHQACNINASPMCQDFKKIIDNLDREPTEQDTQRIREYYAYTWAVSVSSVRFTLNRHNKPIEGAHVLYHPGLLACGKICVWAASNCNIRNDYEKHSICIGSEEDLKDLL